jgi:tripartite-type tricarboxylate transporter receptor subunit TctC
MGLRRRSHRVCMVAALAAAAPAGAQEFPARAVRIIVPFSAGGANDVVARIVAPRVADALGQQVVIDNRPGGAAVIGTELLAKAPANGYTLGIANTSFSANPSLFSKLPYDTERDFLPVSLLSQIPYVLTVHPSVPARTVRELVAIARAKPGTLNYASAGNATGSHLGTEAFNYATGIRMVHIPYGSGGRPIVSTLAGETAVFLATMSSGIPHFKTGKLIPLGISTLTRDPILPDLPTIAEAGVPGYEITEWTGVIAPAGTPAAVIARLQEEFARAVAQPEVRERLTGVGARAVGSTAEALATHIRNELARWPKVVAAAGIRIN